MKAKGTKENKNNPYKRAYFTLLNTSALIEMRIKEVLRPYGITHIHFNILGILDQEAPNTVTPSEIKERLIVSKNPDVTRLVDKLLKKGWVERYTSPSNRRTVCIAITREGVKFSKQIRKELQKTLRNFFADDISQKEAETLTRILTKINL